MALCWSIFAVKLVSVAVKVVVVAVELIAIHPSICVCPRMKSAFQWFGGNLSFKGRSWSSSPKYKPGLLGDSGPNMSHQQATSLVPDYGPWIASSQILPTARRILIQYTVLRRRRSKTGIEFEVSVLAEAVPSIFEHRQMDILNIFDSLRAHEGFSMRNHPEVSPALIGNWCTSHTFVVVSPEIASSGSRRPSQWCCWPCSLIQRSMVRCWRHLRSVELTDSGSI